jgi:hypothetical protein
MDRRRIPALQCLPRRPRNSCSNRICAWKGKPKTFSRDTFALAFVATMMVSGFLMVYAQRMHADVRTRQYVLQLACFELGALLFCIAGGCGVGIFTYRPKSSTLDPSK